MITGDTPATATAAEVAIHGPVARAPHLRDHSADPAASPWRRHPRHLAPPRRHAYEEQAAVFTDPICRFAAASMQFRTDGSRPPVRLRLQHDDTRRLTWRPHLTRPTNRSEEHTSELQSLRHL